MASFVWYAAYGSNLSPERFDNYVRGGRPDGALRTYAGCRDTTAPTGRRATSLPGRVFFGGASQVWGGGMAFYDPARPGPSYATAYRLTAEQFADVWSQECHRPVGGSVPIDDVVAGGDWCGGGGRYDRILLVGSIDEEPVVTFTFAAARPAPNPPAAAYAATIERGLVTSHGLAEGDAAQYVASLITGSIARS
ncbi:histone deacetylase [Flexivirga oryzae]|uniref:Histone deacetylase n=1 Tax=Flexivirga oryzae TaxID=1794944 RepID=A0A839MZI0_9MICO|nr:histone deacetylase [Flexivirga oryzae]MBB2890828.1 hypothetical protein [Flexivirga oryzae]